VPLRRLSKHAVFEAFSHVSYILIPAPKTKAARGPLRVKNCLAGRWLARLLYPQKLPRRPFAMEAVEGQKRPKCSAPKALLFDHFVGDAEQISRNRKPDVLCGFQFFFANSIRSAK
jgi:hypothetical protein